MSTELLPIADWALPVGRTSARTAQAKPAAAAHARPSPVWGGTAAAPPSAEPPEPRELAFGEDDLARACAASAREALRAARDEHAAAMAREERLCIERLERALAQADEAFGAGLAQLAAGLTRSFAAAVAASGLLRTGSAARLEAMLRSTFVEALAAPSLRLTLVPASAAAVRNPLAASLAAAGLDDRIELAVAPLPDAVSMRVDWQDGWAEGDLDHVERLLIEHLSAEAAAMSASPAAPFASEDEP